jgi:2-amino-4,5-dihydroxy-6-oxo-7-(phosphooxy)heptanoate synthase
MLMTDTFARTVRRRRLHHHDPGRLLIVPMDHSVADGPLPIGTLDDLVGTLGANGADAVVLHKGAVRRVSPERFTDTSLIVQLSASTNHAPDPDDKCLVGGVEECLRLGADAVSVHVNMGSDGERRQIADLASVAEACERWNLPLLAMMYARGPRVTDPRDTGLLAHAASIAADFGADLVKVAYPGSPEAMATVVETCPVPVVVAGGPPLDGLDAVRTYVRGAVEGGAVGVAMGRNVFGAEDPAAAARAVAEVLHRPQAPTELAAAG